MAAKSNIPQADFERILSHYNLGEFENATPLTTGTVQTNVLLQTTHGKFVFRCYEQNRSFNSVLFEVNLINYLKHRNYPCPAVFRNTHGKFVGVYKNKPYAMYEFLEGIHIKQPTEGQQQQLLEKVAELQNLTKNYRPSYAKYRWNYGIKLCEQLATGTTNTINTANAREKLKWYKYELSKLVLPKSLPKGICHCDFDFSNVLFKDNAFHALIDFDDANYTFLAFDLAYLIEPFIPAFRWNTWKNYAPYDDVVDLTEARKMVAAYQQHRALNPTEKKYFFDVVILGIFIDCLWFYERGDAHDFFEKRKIDYLNRFGREAFYRELFG